MKQEIIVDVGYSETRVALLEDGELVEIYIERAEREEIVGNIYRGRVENILPGMQAAFIDIGYGKNAFLYLGNALDGREEHGEEESDFEDFEILRSADRVVQIGQEITVQVVKDPIGTKGPRVSTNITLPGRTLVLIPRADYIGVSRRIESEAERQRLKEIAERIKPKGMGLIIRTVGEGLNEEDFAGDVEFLSKLWAKIAAKEKKGAVPRILHRDFSLVFRIIRDVFTPQIDRFVINDKDQYSRAVELIGMISPALKSKVECFKRKEGIFDYYDIESKIEKAVARKVWLKCGGYIVIDQTEALTVIDVNTGKYVGNCDLEDTILRTNTDAAKEIARQLRLRDMGGIIIIDFIDMHSQEHENMVLNTLKNSLKKDRTRTTVIGFTQLGLVEMTRKKVRQGLSAVLNRECPYCGGAGRVLSPESVARNVEREIVRFLNQSLSHTVEVEMNPAIADVLLEAGTISRLENTFGREIKIKPVQDIKYGHIRIV